MDPLAEKRDWLAPYNYVQNNPIMRIDPTGALDWLRVGNEYFWDDRVVDKATAKEFQGKDANYIGKEAKVSVKGFLKGEIMETVSLNRDGSITQYGQTLTGGSDERFFNTNGSEFIPRQTEGNFLGISANFAAIGGFGVAGGMVTDAVGGRSPYFSFNGNIGIGMGIDFDQGKVTPTFGNQFLTKDFGGTDGGYNVGISVPRFSLGYTYGGSLDTNKRGVDAMNPRNFGQNERLTTTRQTGLSYSGGYGAGAMYSITKTWVPK